MSRHSICQKYLNGYAETEIASLDGFDFEFSHVLTLPAYNETVDNIDQVVDSITEPNSLIILVVNSMENSADCAKQANVVLMDNLHQRHNACWKSKTLAGVTLHELKNGYLLLVDKSSDPLCLPIKTGVGLARKIAADLALQLIIAGNIKSRWIHCTDADVILPDQYFMRTSLLKNGAAAVYPYTHRANTNDPAQIMALTLYERSLRHYVTGLRYAGSKYDYHTIGSTIALDAESYAKVRGFPLRESGEDFYILNKLSKVGKIFQPEGAPIIIEGRISDRVPFGTGRSIEKISKLDNMENDFLFYNPIVFEKLKLWINFINKFDRHHPLEYLKENLLKCPEHQVLKQALEAIGAFIAIEKAINSSKENVICQKHLNTWFDSFRTLKLIHSLRDLGYPSIRWGQVLTPS